MKTSESINEISAALAKAQGKIKNPEVNRTANVGTYSYQYADLAKVFDAAKEALSLNGISHSSTTEFIDGHILMCVRLSHSSGQWIESNIPITLQTDPKKLAANLTYYRRYLFSGLVGLASDEDMDGEPDTQKPVVHTNIPKVSEALSEKQISRLYAIVSSSGYSHQEAKDWMKKKFNIESSANLSRTQYDEMCNYFQANHKVNHEISK